jgi:predicted esterase
MKTRTRIVLLLVMGVTACGDDGEGGGATPTATVTATATVTRTPTATVTSTPIALGARALFSADPDSPANPFPSDRLREASGRVQVSAARFSAGVPPEPKYDTVRGYYELVADQINDPAVGLTGFSTFAPMRAVFDGPVTVGDEINPAGVLVRRYDDFAPVDVRARAVTPEVSADHAIEIYPIHPLDPKTRYAYVITTAVHDAAGHPVQPSPDLAAALAAGGSGAGRPDDSFAALIAPVLSHLEGTLGVSRDEIALIDVFTTQPTTDDLIAIKDLFVNGRLPTDDPTFSGTLSGRELGVFPEGTPQFDALVDAPTSPYFAAVAVGSFPSYDFRRNQETAFDRDLVAGLRTPPVNQLDFYVTIPKAPPPPGGYPVVIFQHGLGGEGADAIGMAEFFLGDAAVVGIGISAVQHGLRGDVVFFFDLVDIFAIRENFRQTIADLVQLVRMIRHTSVPPFDQINPDRLHYFGVSLGGIMGTLFMGVEPDVPVGVLSVPGGGLPNIVLDSEEIGRLIKPLLGAVTGLFLNDPYFPVLLNRFTQTAQWLIDPADPVNTAPYVIDPARRLPGVPAKRILMQMGIFDNIVPNRTTEDLARAMGLPDVKATRGCMDLDGCSGIWRFVMTEYGQPAQSGHLVSGLLPEAAAQVTRYLLSAGTEIADATRAAAPMLNAEW